MELSLNGYNRGNREVPERFVRGNQFGLTRSSAAVFELFAPKSPIRKSTQAFRSEKSFFLIDKKVGWQGFIYFW
jgi:hypothetical protein